MKELKIDRDIHIPDKYSFVPEYDYSELTYLIPIARNGCCCLYNWKLDKIVSEEYENIYKYMGDMTIPRFVAVNGNKKGLLEGIRGREVVPIEMDEIYTNMSYNGSIPLLKDGKWGFCKYQLYVEPTYNKMKREQGEFIKVWLNGKCGWIDHQGQFTQDKSKAYFKS